MKKYFDLVLDLLELEEKTEFSELADRLSEFYEKGETVLIAHRYAFLLQAWMQLLSGEIQPEEFVLVGDVDSAFPLWKQGQESSKELLQKLKTWFLPAEDVIVVDELAWKLFLTLEEQSSLLQTLAQQKKSLIAK